MGFVSGRNEKAQICAQASVGVPNPPVLGSGGAINLIKVFGVDALFKRVNLIAQPHNFKKLVGRQFAPTGALDCEVSHGVHNTSGSR